MAKKMVLTVLLPCVQNKEGKPQRVLLGFKKEASRGSEFAGIFNGFGGGVKKGENIRQAATRELFEESGLITSYRDLEWLGIIRARFIHKPGLVLFIHFFKANHFFGLPKETNEMKPQWFLVKELPLKQMWPSDSWWVPLFVEGKKFKMNVFCRPDRSIIEAEIEAIS